MKLMIISTVIPLFFTCFSQTAAADTAPTDVITAWRMWTKQMASSYTFQLATPQEVYRVRVTDYDVTSFTDSRGAEQLGSLATPDTILQVFERIYSASNDNNQRVTATYDCQLGAPTGVIIHDPTNSNHNFIAVYTDLVIVDTPMDAYESNRAKWYSLGATSYNMYGYNVLHEQIPLDTFYPWTGIVVANGVATTAQDAKGTVFTPPTGQFIKFYNPYMLYGELDQALGSSPASIIKVTYDETTGAPTSVFIDWNFSDWDHLHVEIASITDLA